MFSEADSDLQLYPLMDMLYCWNIFPKQLSTNFDFS